MIHFDKAATVTRVYGITIRYNIFGCIELNCYIELQLLY